MVLVLPLYFNSSSPCRRHFHLFKPPHSSVHTHYHLRRRLGTICCLELDALVFVWAAIYACKTSNTSSSLHHRCVLLQEVLEDVLEVLGWQYCGSVPGVSPHNRRNGLMMAVKRRRKHVRLTPCTYKHHHNLQWFASRQDKHRSSTSIEFAGRNVLVNCSPFGSSFGSEQCQSGLPMSVNEGRPMSAATFALSFYLTRSGQKADRKEKVAQIFNVRSCIPCSQDGPNLHQAQAPSTRHQRSTETSTIAPTTM